MAKDRLYEVLKGREENYLLPFFWVHGEPKEVIGEYIEKMYEAGCRAFCVESRPHPDFLGDGWWNDMDFILAKAETLSMKVWILDDAHFPTGYANGRIATAPEALKQKYIRHKELDIAGPVKNARVSITSAPGKSGMAGEGEDVLSVVLVKRINEQDFETDGTFVDLTDEVKEGWLRLNLPEGYYRLYVTVKYRNEKRVFGNYIDMTNPESVKLLLEETYEKHYVHYKERFGNTICGFFSDEPGFYNSEDPGGYVFDYQIGSDMLLPWNPYIEEELAEKLISAEIIESAEAVRKVLPALWFPCGERTEEIRACYMDTITDLYRKNFTGQISKWCENHGVEYIGHVIEDNNCHCRLGCGPGHYFRSLSGQHMAGVDVVLLQILPGKDRMQFGMSSHGPQDAAFNYYGLAKMGASMAHMDPKTKGRAMCEIFGAYGWEEGITMMKWLADHMLVRGINTFVPHAFTEQKFPDPDCPPHFYARGNNPQYRHMRKVFDYMNRVSHLLNGGKPVIRTGILYHGEMEWLGRSVYFQNIGRELYRKQIDYDVIDFDHLLEAEIADGKIRIGMLELDILLIPLADRYPKEIREVVLKCQEADVKVIQVMAALPDGTRYGNNWYFSPDARGELLDDCYQVPLEEVAGYLVSELELTDMEGDTNWLRFYHYVLEDGRHAYMLFNESMAGSVRGKVKLPVADGLVRYDAVENTLVKAAYDAENGMELMLWPGEAAIFVSGDENVPYEAVCDDSSWKIYDGEVRISAASYQNMEDFYEKLCIPVSELASAEEKLTDFAGILRYELTIDASNGLKMLDLGDVKDAAEVWINGESAGVRIGYPYRFDVSKGSVCGKNEIRVEVATTLVNMECDMFSKFGLVEPEGMRGPIMVK